MSKLLLVRKVTNSTLYYINADMADAVGKSGAINTKRVDNGAYGTHDGTDLEFVGDDGL